MVPLRATLNQSSQSHSLTLLLRLSSFLMTLRISSPMWCSFLSTPFLPHLDFFSLARFLCLCPQLQRWPLSSQPIKLAVLFSAVADPKVWPFEGNVICNGSNVSTYCPVKPITHTHTCKCIHVLQHSHIQVAFGLWLIPLPLFLKNGSWLWKLPSFNLPPLS